MHYLGIAEFGRTFTFTTSNRAADGSAIAGFTPAFYDLILASDGTVVLANQALTQVGSRALWRGTIASDDLESYGNYAVIVKADTNANPTVFLEYNFSVTGSVVTALGLQGENMVIDLYEYDAGNNLLSCRQRLFDNAADADAATLDIVALEPGEIARYTVTQTFSSGLQLRLSHKCIRET